MSACRTDDAVVVPEGNSTSESSILLHFYQNDTESKAEFETGLKWGFSYLGAALEKGSWLNATNWQSTNVLKVDFSRLNFNAKGLAQIQLLLGQLKQSEEYKKTGAIDAGRLIACFLNNPNHYYKIVGMPNALNRFTSSYSFLQKRAAIIESAVAFKERLIQMPNSTQSITSLGYWAEELVGSLKDSSHKTVENEVMDIMSNGQLRFGIYDTNGIRINGADGRFSSGGKPVKCLWCHEVNIQQGFAALTEIPGYCSPNQFDSIVAQNTITLNSYRVALNSEIDFNRNAEHAEVEKLYIRYFEPSAKRLAGEWSVTEAEVSQILSGLSTHTQVEFAEFGLLYYREEVAQFMPYSVLESTSSARETINSEPDLLP